MDYRAYPTQREAAALLRVSASTLSRKRLTGVRVGRRDIRLPAAILLETAKMNNWVPLESLATALVGYAQSHCPEAVAEVTAQIDAWFADTPSKPTLDREAFLFEAARALPPGLFKAILPYYPAVSTQTVQSDKAEIVKQPTPDGGD
jgi:hypothetical protein